MKNLKHIQMETKIKYEPIKQRKLPIYLTQIEKHESGNSALEVLGIIAVLVIVGIAIALAVILGA